MSNSGVFDDPLTELNTAIWWKADGWSNGFPFLSRWEGESVTFDEAGMTLHLMHDPIAESELAYRGGELRSHHYYDYGCFEAEIKAVNAPGVITAFFLFAGPYDTPPGGNGRHNEIDIEFLGHNTNLLQVNYWTNDDNYAYSNERIIFLDFDASEDFHHYSIKWSSEAIRWYVDGELVYLVHQNTTTPIPSSADSQLRIMANLWATDPAIANWAGTFDEASQASHQAHYRNFRFTPGDDCEITQ
ncbi:family 16 glycosylhydrolase [Photobacterium japonica]|uniref:family 16 glycosylhydrolase n=1 Tax=Photobacterium japonica TaxID=2910235 RepID=UPI003D10D3A8